MAAIAVGITDLLAIPKHAKTACEFSGIPVIADTCAEMGVPGIPHREERQFWEDQSQRGCDGFDAYLKTYPQGTFASEARQKLGAASEERSPAWTSRVRTHSAFVGMAESAFSSEQLARKDALSRAFQDAERVSCQPTSDYERFVGIGQLTGTHVCRILDRGHFCSIDYKVECRMEERKIERVCR